MLLGQIILFTALAAVIWAVIAQRYDMWKLSRDERVRPFIVNTRFGLMVDSTNPECPEWAILRYRQVLHRTIAIVFIAISLFVALGGALVVLG